MTNSKQAASRGALREVRAFVSSTFRDMQAERDRLAKFIFPELRRRCRERGVEFVEVDLRWGVTEEQAERGEVLPICLAEIDNCRPYFIGLLGERYGFVPEHIDPELELDQPWLAEHRSHSLTALEILHGALNAPRMAGRAFFYFREPHYSETLPEKHRTDFSAENPAAADKLAALKRHIEQSGLPLRRDYATPEIVCQWIEDDLWQAIDSAWPADSKSNPLDREATDHEAFAESRARVYIGREAYYERLDRHIVGDDTPLVLLGESGSGKSALLANWVRRYRQAHPETFLIQHYIGSSPQSADCVGLLTRILGEIKRRYDLNDEIPAAPDKLKEAFPLWLAQASAKGGLLLVLDGLNQIEDRDNAPELDWLPNYFPPNCRLIVSTLPGRSLEALQLRDWPSYTVEVLKPDERRQVIEDYLWQYRRRLEPQRIERILDVPQSANPLYLRALLEELRVFGIYEVLDARIDHYLKAPTVLALYRKILERLEKDYEQQHPGLVREALTLLWAARRGLTEQELLELLGTPDQLLPRAVWSPLYLAMQGSLVSRSGLIGFFHDYLRHAIEEHFLDQEESKRATHLTLADYFDEQALDERKVDELPWQLRHAEHWERLKDCITDLEMFLKLNTEEKQYELMSYWLTIGKQFDIVEEYRVAQDQYEKTAASEEAVAFRLNSVANFLLLNARYDGAEPLYCRVLAIYEKVLGAEHPHTAVSLNNLAGLLYDKGDYAGAESLLRRALSIREQALGAEHPKTATSLNDLTGLLRDKGDYEGAEPLCRWALSIKEKLLGIGHPDTAVSLNTLAGLLYAKGDYAGAEPLYRRASAHGHHPG